MLKGDKFHDQKISQARSMFVSPYRPITIVVGVTILVGVTTPVGVTILFGGNPIGPPTSGTSEQ